MYIKSPRAQTFESGLFVYIFTLVCCSLEFEYL